MKQAIGIDIGGTKIAAGLVKADHSCHYRQQVATQTESAEALFSQVLELIQSMVKTLEAEGESFEGIGIGLPGKVDHQAGIAVFQNNIPWENFPVVQRLQTYFPDLKIVIDNDVKAAALAEYYALDIPSQETFSYVTISTGIASATIDQGQFIRGAGFSGEIGFLPIYQNRSDYTRLEAGYAGPAIARSAQKYVFDHSISNTKEVFDAWRSGSESAGKIIEASAKANAFALYTIATVIDPHAMVLGGSVPVKNPDYFQLLKDELSQLLVPEQSHLLQRLTVSQLVSDNGIIGAGWLVMGEV